MLFLEGVSRLARLHAERAYKSGTGARCLSVRIDEARTVRREDRATAVKWTLLAIGSRGVERGIGRRVS